MSLKRPPGVVAAQAGRAVLGPGGEVGNAAVIANVYLDNTSEIVLTRVAEAGASPGQVRVWTRTNGNPGSFAIESNSFDDTSTIEWSIYSGLEGLT